MTAPGLAVSAALQRPDARCQLAEAERLREVSSAPASSPATRSSSVERAVSISTRGPGSSLMKSLATQFAAHRHSVHVGQADVEAHDVVGRDAESLERACAVADSVDRVSLTAKPRGEGGREVGLVLDDQQAHGRDRTRNVGIPPDGSDGRLKPTSGGAQLPQSFSNGRIGGREAPALPVRRAGATAPSARWRLTGPLPPPLPPRLARRYRSPPVDGRRGSRRGNPGSAPRMPSVGRG